MIKNIFYDLDGTLLPMDMELFMKGYFAGICKKLAPLGYDPEKLISSIWIGTKAMVMNDGSRTNSEAFWERFDEVLPGSKKDEPVFEDFYKNEFNDVKNVVVPNPTVPKMIKDLKAKGFRQILATNPVFPEIATRNRIEWASLDIEDFELFTSYENSHYCKPNPKYYEEVLAATGCKAAETLMVGNDVDEDMLPASSLGMKVFLITDFVLNKSGTDINRFPHGSFDDLIEYIEHIND